MEGENVVWQSRNGTWNRGFFKRLPSDGAHEYDYSAFRWASTGHATQEEALTAGPETPNEDLFVMPYKGNSVQTKDFDRMALEFRDPVAALAYKRYANSRVARRGHQTMMCGAVTGDGSPCQNPVATRGRKCRWHRY
jgi:hypothetical protein